MRYEISLEIADGWLWADVHFDRLVRVAAGLGSGVWRRVDRGWGVVLELDFPDEREYLLWRASPAVQAAIEAVAERMYVRRGWGGADGDWAPGRCPPLSGCEGAAIDVPRELQLVAAVAS